MIVVPEDELVRLPSKASEAEEPLKVMFIQLHLEALTNDGLQTSESDPPPSYSLRPDEVASGSERQCQLPLDIKPSNFTRLQRTNGAVKGTWLVDTSLFIPQSFLPPLESDETEETRNNISLQSKNGAVDVDIFIKTPNHDAAGVSSSRSGVRICTSSHNGSVTTRVASLSS